MADRGDGADGYAAVVRDDHLDIGLEFVADGVGGLARVAVEGRERDPVTAATDDRGVPDALSDVPLHLPDDPVVLALDLFIGDDAADQVVADVLPEALLHHHLAEDLRAGVLVLPEVVVADDPRDLDRHRIVGGEVACDDPGRAGGDVDVEEARLLLDGADLLVLPAVVVAPLDPPPVGAGFREALLDTLLVADIRYAEEVAPAGRAGDGVEEGEELADRSPDGEDVPVLPAVDGIAPGGVEVVVREVHDVLRPPGESLHKIRVPGIRLSIASSHSSLYRCTT